MDRRFYVYMMTNKHNTVLSTGVTKDLVRRAYEHRTGRAGGFTSKYRVSKLVYYEAFVDARSAIEREKQIKAGSRQKKVDLVNGLNQEWRDLYEELSA